MPLLYALDTGNYWYLLSFAVIGAPTFLQSFKTEEIPGGFAEHMACLAINAMIGALVHGMMAAHAESISKLRAEEAQQQPLPPVK